MEKTIYKYVLKDVDEQAVSLPVGAEILTVQNQHEKAVLWALVNPEEKELTRRDIHIFGTGNPIGDIMGMREYISTFQLYGGNLVFHAFEYKGI